MADGPKRSPNLRCAIYTRKSSEEGLEQEFNSLQAQREACEAFITSQKGEGWQTLKAHYDDGGWSGGTLDRPAMQRFLLMTDRHDLEDQIYKTFAGSGITGKETPRATTGADLEQLLKENHPYIFTLPLPNRCFRRLLAALRLPMWLWGNLSSCPCRTASDVVGDEIVRRKSLLGEGTDEDADIAARRQVPVMRLDRRAIDKFHQSFHVAELGVRKPFLNPVGLPHEVTR